ncbi:MAG: hypothetical protein RIT81_16440 [Deltaproteobacteria bacterium]
MASTNPRRAPFPGALPASAWLRPFCADFEDLEIDLDAADPLLASRAIVHRCTQQVGEQVDLDALPVSDRVRALLVVTDLTGGTATVQHSCTACGELLELPLPLRDIAERTPRSAPQLSLSRDGSSWKLRLPTTRDQLGWTRRTSRADALRGLVVEGPADAATDDAWCEAVDARFAEHDPLVDFTISTACPACRHPTRIEVDLEALAIAALRRHRGELLWIVHRLALAYHWDEATILGLPADRRRVYLAMIEESGA